jgi:hypothetical protein
MPIVDPPCVGYINLPQGYLGEVGEWCSPGGGAGDRAGTEDALRNPPIHRIIHELK